jgi:hypothetical protein
VKIPNIFRSLRSGKEFSPWSLGPPIPAAFEFSITKRLAEVHAERMAREAMGYESEDEREVEDHKLPPSPPFQAWSERAYSPLSPLTPLQDPIKLPTVPPMSLLPPSSTIPLPSTSSAATRALPPSPSRTKKKKKPRHKKTDHRKAGAKKCRLRQRLRHMEKTQTLLKAVNIRRRKDINPIHTNVSATNWDHASSAWIGKPEEFDRLHYDEARLTGPEFNFVKYSWDGK